MLNHSQNLTINGGSFHVGTIQTAGGLDVLYKQVAPNAILNSGGRADDPKCCPGTREEVIDLMDRWMDDHDGDRIMWLSGPAGGGKTAIMKTIAEQRKEMSGINTANFFFFREDSTRRNSQPVIATILYQLLELYPVSSKAIATALSGRPLLLDGSIKEQCHLLSIISGIIQKSTANPRIILLIDGLDECDEEAGRSQSDILRAFEALVTEPKSPFRLLVASRPEAHIQMAFNELPSRAQTIFLDEKYSPEEDIRHFVTVEFDRIKATHPSARFLPPYWPLAADVEAIVATSSGQFIYAATVMRYLAHATTVPSLSLDRVKGIVPAAKNTPFKHLDSIYMFILSQVDDLEATRDILFMGLQHSLFESLFPLEELLHQYNSRYTQAVVQSCLSELSALVQLRYGIVLNFYHKSLSDFLNDQTRSGVYWIDMDVFRARAIVRLWEKQLDTQGTQTSFSNPARHPGVLQFQDLLFHNLAKPTPEITHMLLNLPMPDWTRFVYRRTARKPHKIQHGARFAEAIRRMYFQEDVETYKKILERFISATLSHGECPYTTDIPYAELFLPLDEGNFDSDID